MRTVGVAPGSFTLRLGAAAACPPDPVGGSYGVPEVGWYDNPTAPGALVWENPYGTESTLKGTDAFSSSIWPTIGFLTLLGAVGGFLFVRSWKHAGKRRH